MVPIKDHGFALHKGAFQDALCLRYNWHPPMLPTTCVCNKSFTIDHALNCPTGGFPTIRHNELRDFTAEKLSVVCHNVCIEPHLQPLTGEKFNFATTNVMDGARADVSAQGFWGDRYQRAFFDVKVFNPNSSSYRNLQLTTAYRNQEREKQRKYEQCIRESRWVRSLHWYSLPREVCPKPQPLHTKDYSISTSGQTRPTLFNCDGLAPHQSVLLPAQISHHLLAWSKVICRTRCQRGTTH